MPHGVMLVLALFVAFIPAQTRRASRMAIETRQDACSGLTDAECCAQSLEVACFRATGDQVPRAAKTPLRLSCADATQGVPEGACRSIALARGIPVKDIGVLCTAETLEKRCDDAAACKNCVRDLDKLHFASSYRACYPVTYTTPVPAGDATVIILQTGKQDDANGGIEIRRRRTVLR